MGLTIDHWPPERIPKNKEVPNSGASERNHCYRFCLLKKINRKAYTNRTILFESKNIGPLLWLAFFLRSLDTCSSCFPVLAEKDATAAMDDSRMNGLPRQSWKRDRQISLHRQSGSKDKSEEESHPRPWRGARKDQHPGFQRSPPP